MPKDEEKSTKTSSLLMNLSNSHSKLWSEYVAYVELIFTVSDNLMTAILVPLCLNCNTGALVHDLNNLYHKIHKVAES